MQHPIEVLEHYWKFTSFKPLQEDIINAVLNGDDTLVLLPTGGGKSLCFQIPALIKEGICIVISPLVALMKDQVNSLINKGIKAMAITSGISQQDLDALLDNCIYGNYKFLYLSPERLQQDIVQVRIQQMNVNLIVVDEAHCISHWGNDFRPAYKNISILRELHPSVNCIALTATATQKVEQEIAKDLDFIAPKLFKASFERPNIAYIVLHAEDKYYKIEQILKKYKGSSIIYVRNRKLTIEISDYLTAKGFSCTFYHGGINSNEKQERLHQWTTDQKEIMVATTAFGMGIDKPNVKTVIHVNLPESMESYYQEAGRAGRNNDSAFAIILKNNIDENQLKNQFLKTLPTIDFIKLVYKKLCNYFQIPYGEGENNLHQFSFNDFCKAYQFNSILAFNSLQILDRNSIICLTQQFNYKAQLQFIISNSALFGYLKSNTMSNSVIKSILRTYGGIFDHLTTINLGLIADKAEVTQSNTIRVLQQLQLEKIVDFHFFNTDSEITFLQPREDDKTINRIAKTVEQQHLLKVEKVNAVINYVNNDSVCKHIQILNYFEEKTDVNCGICSVCISKKETKNDNPKDVINNIILHLENKPLSSRHILEKLEHDENMVLNTLQSMVENKVIEVTSKNTYRLKS